jgi:DNA-binding MarR family transcriptional regulator
VKIEEAIKTRGFNNEGHKASVNLIYTYNWLQERVKKFLKDYDLTNQQFNVLRILRGSYPEPISTATIRDRMLDKMSDSSRIVDRLYQKGLLMRKSCKEDKRLVDIIISEEGLKLLKKIDRNTSNLDKILNLNKKEAGLLNELLDKSRS